MRVTGDLMAAMARQVANLEQQLENVKDDNLKFRSENNTLKMQLEAIEKEKEGLLEQLSNIKEEK